jgi:hypothetical protein
MYLEVLAVDALPNSVLLQDDSVRSVAVASSCLYGSNPEARHNGKFHQSSPLEKDLSAPFYHSIISTENEIQVRIFKQILI